MNKAILSIILIMMLQLASMPVIAQEIAIQSIDPSPYYDSKPCIHGNYIVWRRAVNQNNNQYIELKEPSWIMVYDIQNGKSWNITEENTLMASSNIYYHAQSPEIYGDKIIYEKQCSDNSWDTKLFMYNISNGQTWQIPLKSTDYSHGHIHLIYGDWIAYTHSENDKKQAYLINYRDWSYRTIIGKGENYSVYGMVMWDTNIVISALNNSGGMELLRYNIMTTEREPIMVNRNYSRITATSIYERKVGINVYESDGNTSHWRTYVMNLDTDYLDQFKSDIYGIMLWEDKIIYEESGNIHIYVEGTATTTISSIGKQYLGDVYQDDIVWMDNSNSETNYGDPRDDLDIFLRKEITPTDMVWDNRYFIVILIIGVSLLILFGRSGKGDMV